MLANPRSVPTVPVRSPFDRARHATFWTLLIGYAAYYLCRANLGVAAPLLQNELHLDKTQIGQIGGIATLVYAAGKFTLGPTADVFGGKRIFLFGLGISIAANVVFGFSTGLFVFILIWSVNRFAQSAGWMGLVQLVSHWYERGRYGVVMAWLSLSFLLGDVASRGFGALLLRLGFGWRALFFAPAMVCVVFLFVATRTLTAPPRPATSNDDGVKEIEPVGQNLRAIFSVLIHSGGFWMSCLLSFLLTFLRTVFLDWTALYLVDSGAAAWKAALQSALFPLAGAAGTLFAGWYSDRISKSRRGPIAAGMLAVLVVALTLLATIGATSPWLALGLITVAGFLLLGPYSLLGGCLALDYGGKRAAATAAGLNDGVGYLGGSASGLVLAGLVEKHGWTFAFFVLAAASAVAFVVALIFSLTIEKASLPTESA
jgi:sugar phosphate permease